MISNHDIPDQYVKGEKNPKIPCGLSVRTNLQAGEWHCTDCQGEVMGSSLYKPKCAYCEHY